MNGQVNSQPVIKVFLYIPITIQQLKRVVKIKNGCQPLMLLTFAQEYPCQLESHKTTGAEHRSQTRTYLNLLYLQTQHTIDYHCSSCHQMK